MSTGSQKQSKCCSELPELGVNNISSPISFSERTQQHRDLDYMLHLLEKHQITWGPQMALQIRKGKHSHTCCNKKWMSSLNEQTIGNEMSEWGWLKRGEREDKVFFLWFCWTLFISGTVLESCVNTLPPWFISYPLKPHWKGKGERKGGEGEWRWTRGSGRKEPTEEQTQTRTEQKESQIRRTLKCCSIIIIHLPRFVLVWPSSCRDVDRNQNRDGGGQQDACQLQSACVEWPAIVQWRHGALG